MRELRSARERRPLPRVPGQSRAPAAGRALAGLNPAALIALLVVLIAAVALLAHQTA
ncbi:hypothetical protein SALBM135S_06997 [Streptomyces alboniger]